MQDGGSISTPKLFGTPPAETEKTSALHMRTHAAAPSCTMPSDGSAVGGSGDFAVLRYSDGSERLDSKDFSFTTLSTSASPMREMIS